MLIPYDVYLASILVVITAMSAITNCNEMRYESTIRRIFINLFLSFLVIVITVALSFLIHFAGSVCKSILASLGIA